MGLLLRDLDDNLYDAFEALKRSTDAETIEVTLRVERYSRHRINIPFFSRLAEWISRLDVRESIDALQIRGVDRETGRTQEFDLLQEFLVSKKKVARQDDIHRSVSTPAMYSAIEEAYHELRSEIDMLIGRGNRHEP